MNDIKEIYIRCGRKGALLIAKKLMSVAMMIETDNDKDMLLRFADAIVDKIGKEGDA